MYPSGRSCGAGRAVKSMGDTQSYSGLDSNRKSSTVAARLGEPKRRGALMEACWKLPPARKKALKLELRAKPVRTRPLVRLG